MRERIEKRKSKSEGFMKSVLILMFSQVLIKLLGFVYRVYLTNREGFGDEGNAIYSGGYQIYAILLTISSIGVPNAISKLVSEKVAVGNTRGANRILKIALMTFGIVGLCGTLLLFFGAGYISNVILQISDTELTLVALSPAIFFVSVASVMRGYFNGRDRISATAKSQTLEQIFKTVLTIVVVEVIVLLYGTNVVIMAAGANLATTLSVLLSFLYLGIYYKIYSKSDRINRVDTESNKSESVLSIVKRIIFVSLPITLSAIMSTLNKNVDSMTVIRYLKRVVSEKEATIQYGILSGKVDTLITLPLSFNVAFSTALVPSISASIAKNDTRSAAKRISFSMLLTMIIGLPFTLGMVVFAQPIINLIFPNATSGAVLLQISSFTIIFSVLAQTANGALQGLGKISIPAISGFAGLVVKIIANVTLIKWIGVNGAAIGSNLNNIVVFLVSYIVLKNTIKLDLKFGKFFIKPFIATAIMCICSFTLYKFLVRCFGSRKTCYNYCFSVCCYIVFYISYCVKNIYER